MTRIVSLEAQNVMRLRAVHIEPDGRPVVVVGGNNGNGKSSVLRSIEMALGGKNAIPPEPVRQGEESASTTVRLSNGLVVTRTFDAGGSTKLVIVDADGAKVKSPQSVLDKMYRTLAIDPVAMARMKPADQAKLLQEIAGVDTSALDQRRKAVYDQRTDVNREVKRLKGRVESLPRHADVPDEEVSVAQLAAELQAANRGNDDRARWGATLKRAENEVLRLEEELRQARDAVERLRAEEADIPPHVDTEAITQRMAAAEATNAKVRDNRARAEAAKERDEAAAQSERLTEELREIDAEKEAALAAASMPIPGLGFDDVGVTLDGVPLEQASQAQQLRLWTAVGFRQNPELKVLLVRSGSDLDEESLRLMAELAEEEGGEVWLERVSTGDECTVVIEDGAVASAPRDTVPSARHEPEGEWEDFA